MLKFAVIIMGLLFPGILLAQEIQLFNPASFGKSVDKPIVFLFKPSSGTIAPLSILADVKNGKYYAATITYSKEISIEDLKEAIRLKHTGLAEKQLGEKLYGFRNEKDKYAIQVSETNCYIQAIYLQFVPTEEIFESLKNISECM